VIVGFIVLTIAAIGVYAVVGADLLQVAPRCTLWCGWRHGGISGAACCALAAHRRRS